MFGVDPTTGDFTDAHAAAIAAFATSRIREGWEWDYWPEWTLCERRQYRPSYDAGEPYGLAAEVLYDDNYYYSLQAANTGNTPDTADTWWKLVSDVAADVDEDYEFDRYVDTDQTGETAIGEVRSVSSRNPRVSNFPGNVAFSISSNGVQPSSLAPNRVWVQFRMRPPEYSTSEWASGTAYAIGDVVYVDSTGQCYMAVDASTGEDPTSATDYWTVQDVPFVLVNFLKRATYADLLVEDGQESKAEKQENRAYAFLADAWDVTIGQQGQQDRAEVIAG